MQGDQTKHPGDMNSRFSVRQIATSAGQQATTAPAFDNSTEVSSAWVLFLVKITAARVLKTVN